jgi:hypothetical protein
MQQDGSSFVKSEWSRPTEQDRTTELMRMMNLKILSSREEEKQLVTDYDANPDKY